MKSPSIALAFSFVELSTLSLMALNISSDDSYPTLLKSNVRSAMHRPIASMIVKLLSRFEHAIASESKKLSAFTATSWIRSRDRNISGRIQSDVQGPPEGAPTVSHRIWQILRPEGLAGFGQWHTKMQAIVCGSSCLALTSEATSASFRESEDSMRMTELAAELNWLCR
jgi:hypothetical protein